MQTIMIRTIGVLLAVLISVPALIAQQSNSTSEKDDQIVALQNQMPDEDSESYAHLHQMIELDLQNATLEEALISIANEADLKLMYRKALLPVDQRVTFQNSSMTVYDALWDVLDGTGIQFGISQNKQLVLLRMAKPQKTIDFDEEIQESVSGRVTDSETGEALPGVNILVDGTTTGTSTDENGEFEITVPSLDETLIVSYIGYQTQEIHIEGRSVIDVSLQSADIVGEELVVIGYGTRDVTGLTGSVSSMDVDRVANEATGNVIKSLQGNVPGVTVVRGKTPGSGASVRIHGLGTIGDNNPLFVVDGVQTSAHNLSPSEIESITVLKDAASTAVYGARGSNGVVLIQTKEGIKEQGPRVSYSSRFGISQQYKKHDMLGVQELGEVRYLTQINSGIENPSDPMYRYGPNGEVDIYNYVMPASTDNVDESLYDRQFSWQDGDGVFLITRSDPNGTDWFDAVTRVGSVQDHSFTVTGGSELSTYGITAGFNEEKASIGESRYNRINLRVKSTHDVTDWLKLSENIRLYRSENAGYQNQGAGGIIGQALRVPQIIPLTDITGYHSPFTAIPGAHGNNNPVASIDHGKNIRNINLGVSGDAFAEINPIENLQVKSLLGFSLGNSHNRSPLPATPEEITPRVFNQLNESFGRSTFWSLTNTLTYLGTIGMDHSYEILLGNELMESSSRSIGASRQKFFQGSPNYMVLSAGEENMTNSGGASEWGSISFFGRLHYELYNRYLFDITLRRDGSSRFGAGNRYGNFPAAAFAWRVTEESFMNGTENWLSELKLRLSWGKSGNDRIGNYNTFTTYNTSNVFSYYPIQGQNNALNAGFQSASFGNPNIKWETTTSQSVGLDVMLFERLNISFDLWQRVTDDMLYPKSIPFVNGIASVPSVNIGEMKNSGFDIGLNYNGVINNELSYSFSANISHFQNEIVRLSDAGGEFIEGPEIREQYYTRAEPGTPFPAFYGYQVEGIFQTEEEVNNHPPAFGDYNRPGRFKFKDVNEDGVVNSDDRTYLGDPHPDIYGSFSGNLGYKNFDLSFQFYGNWGNDIMNVERRLMDFNFFQINRGTRRLYESWGSPYLENNADAKMPIAELNDSDSQRPSSYYIEDGSFLRLQQLEIGYTFPSILSGTVRQLRFFAMATDLFTLSNFSGLDPEMTWDGMSGGINFGTWATARRVMFGVTFDM